MQVWDEITGWFSGATDVASGAFNSAKSSLTTAINAVGTQAQEWSMEWQAAVDNLKAKAQEFQRVFSQLQTDATNVPVELKPAYDSLMSRGQWVKNQIQSITSGIDFGFNMFASNPILHGIRREGMGSLGVVQVIPVAIIVGGVAVLGAWLADAYVMQSKINLAKSSKAKPGEIPGIIGAGTWSGAAAGGANFFQSAGIMLLIGVGVIIFMPTIKAALRGRK
jgi:hypothetical protein